MRRKRRKLEDAVEEKEGNSGQVVFGRIGEEKGENGKEGKKGRWCMEREALCICGLCVLKMGRIRTRRRENRKEGKEPQR